ncbi:hypothetical protein ACSFBX_22025 [Variovorax sp. RB2P76]|uniref:hypothetical protein n=1 Tax=Variovorax sp. RB2P76 TaxID=3443736 RepID=UPI003F453A24
MISSLKVAAERRCRCKEVWARYPFAPRRRAAFVYSSIANNPAVEQITAMRVLVEQVAELFAPDNNAAWR